MPPAPSATGSSNCCQLPVNIGGRDHFVCASIGITLFPDDGSTIDDLMRNADTAMYRAKDSGRGCNDVLRPAPGRELRGGHRDGFATSLAAA